jgi:hypothetical protein
VTLPAASLSGAMLSLPHSRRSADNLVVLGR